MGHHQGRSHPVEGRVTVGIRADGRMRLLCHGGQEKGLLPGIVLVGVLGAVKEGW